MIVQGVLKNNFYQGSADGVFGLLTETAVKAFQKNQNLAIDGVVGSKTWAALGNFATMLAFV